MLKRCRGCDRDLPAAAFYEQLTRHGRYRSRSRCMDCVRAARRERYWRGKAGIEVVAVRHGQPIPEGYQRPDGAHAGGGHDSRYVVRAWRST